MIVTEATGNRWLGNFGMSGEGLPPPPPPKKKKNGQKNPTVKLPTAEYYNRHRKKNKIRLICG